MDFRLVLARKDLALTLHESQELGLDLELLRTVIARYDEAVAAGLGDEDITAVVRHLRG